MTLRRREGPPLRFRGRRGARGNASGANERAMEATGGILMFGISTGLGLAVVNMLLKRLKENESES